MAASGKEKGLLDFERSPPIQVLLGICGVICIWGGPLRTLGFQLSGVEGGGGGGLVLGGAGPVAAQGPQRSGVEGWGNME